jgi:hypothetical protein
VWAQSTREWIHEEPSAGRGDHRLALWGASNNVRLHDEHGEGLALLSNQCDLSSHGQLLDSVVNESRENANSDVRQPHLGGLAGSDLMKHYGSRSRSAEDE